ncbi:peroxidase 11 isoform X3 [Vigna radiata var. radiata]|uniref:peroxidase n=1 Tax=Vigna radiata var. radiata TaxID=3916 RepID=A0A3Q0EQF3_VIGRR|nr:peroxidase 11 isoform X3 [Vigna radiata var. radiata]
MEDVITEAAGPSRFLEEDLNIFTTPSPPLPLPFLIFPYTQQPQPLKPSLLIVALSPSSVALFHRLRTVSPAASLLLPELSLSLPDHAAQILPLSPSALLAAIPFPVPASRAYAVAKALLDGRIRPDSVLILDSLESRNFRGKLSSDEAVAFKLDTAAERKRSGGEKLLPDLEYYPSGSVVDGLGAAILARCQVTNVRASLCVSWPQFDASVVSLIKGLLQRRVLQGFDFDLSDEDVFKFGFLGATRLHASDPPLTLDYYASTCPTVFDIVRKEMECAVLSDPRNAAKIVRLHFHDCFVQVSHIFLSLSHICTSRSAIVDRIKNMVESECPGVVSCADILTIAARDAVILVGGPYWDVPVGRKDSVTANFDLANTNLPTPEETLLSIIAKFLYQGLSVTDMVALAGAHTIGMAQCKNFRSRIYGGFDTTPLKNPISESHLSNLRSVCPAVGGGDNNITAMDYLTPNLFDNSFYQLLLNGEGVLNSDQEMYSSLFGIETRELVKKYAADPLAFFQQFSESMVKMGNITNSESFITGEVRKNCRFVNT